KTCGACHPQQFASQSLSAHAAALFRAVDHPLAGSFPTGRILSRKPDYQFDFFRSDGAMRARVFDAVNVMDLPVGWAFGAGIQAVTFLSRVDRDWYLELYFTYYSALRSYGPTPGQSDVTPASLPQAAGLMYKASDPVAGVAGCFECHSTGPVTLQDEISLGEFGVRCEACHGAGAAHAARPSRKNIQNPKQLSAARLNDFCGRCHRPPAANDVKIDWNYSWNVRHQPIYLSESACFRKSSGALSCLTCHNPHEAAGKKQASYYNSRC